MPRSFQLSPSSTGTSKYNAQQMVLGSLPSHVHIVGEAWSRKGYLGCACLEPADVVSGNASGEADKPALAEAAVARHDTVLPVPVPAEVEAADAVDTDTRLNHSRIGAFYRVVSRLAPRTSPGPSSAF